MRAEDSSSSLDPISILTDSSPFKQSRGISKGPTALRTGRLSSPSKSMVFNAMGDNGSSPVRLRVTVQEEPHTSPSRSSSRNTRTMTVPLKSAEEASPVKRRTRTTSNISSASKADSHSARKSTPPRRRMTPARSARPVHFENGDESTHSPLIDLHTGQISADYGVDHQSITGSHSEQTDAREGEGDYSLSVMEPMEDAPLMDEPHGHQVSDEAMWRAMARRNTTQLPEAPDTNDDDDDYSLSEDAKDDDNGDQQMRVPGEMTVMESEEFSMISVDSLSSHQTGQSPAVSVLRTKQSKPTASELGRSKVNSSYLPSSPPTMPNNQETPIIDEPIPTEPPGHVNPEISFPPVMTSLRESVVRSGRVLQDIVRSPDPNRPAFNSDDSARSVFGGFTSGTRRQLSASLQVGATLADNKSPLEGRTKYLSPSHLTKEARSNHRLPTPEDHEHTSASKSFSTDTTAGIVYPELTSGRHTEASSGKEPAYDAMSWVPTGKATLISPVSTNHMSDGRKEVHQDLGISLNAMKGRESQAPPAFFEQDGNDMDEASNEEEEDRDIWQEEASRSFEEEDGPTELVEAPIKPRRSKLPGTWRRISGNNFHYSDSPEPEEREMRKTSRSSAEDSAIATPPTSDSHYDDDDLEESIDEDDIEEAISPSSEGDALTPHSEASVQDGDDTGLFWQANMPSVFQRQGQPPLQKVRADISMVSELKPLSSPVNRTSPDKAHGQSASSALNMRPFEGRAGKTEHSSSALVTPLRKSLLKSSKIRSSPLVQDISCMSAMTDEAEQAGKYNESDHHTGMSRTQDNSMAFDTRQLLGEMATARRRASQAMEDIMHSRQSISQTLATDLQPTDVDLTKSYIEHLNHESPTKVVVNFNDSSIMGSSSLLAPRRTYPALFDDVPGLDGSKRSAKEVTTTVVSPPSPVKLVSRLTNSFWDVVTGTDGSKDIPPPAKGPQQQSEGSVASPSKLERESTTVPGTNVSDDVLRLRRKYGLLLNTQPFTMAHIRTLHRMLISTRQHASSSIVPLTQPLPTSLQTCLNTTRRVGEVDIVLDKKVLATIAAFMGLLVPQTEIKRLEALGSWGDDGAKKARDFDSRGRHGSYLAFGVEGTEADERAARKAGSMKGKIEGSWLVDVVVEILGKERASGR